jgi:hypothetical protein
MTKRHAVLVLAILAAVVLAGCDYLGLHVNEIKRLP